LTRFGQEIARAIKSVAVMLFSDLAFVGAMTVLMISQDGPYQSQDKSRPYTTRDAKALRFTTTDNSNIQHLRRALPLVVLVNLLRLSRIYFQRHNNSLVLFLPNLSLLTPSQACGGFGPWRANVWSGACVSGTLRCVGDGCFAISRMDNEDEPVMREDCDENGCVRPRR